MTGSSTTPGDDTGQWKGTIALLRGGAGSAALSLGFVGLSFVISVVLARTLGASGFGAYSFAYALAMVLALPTYSGIAQLVIRETARSAGNGDWARVRGLWFWSNRTGLIASMVLTLLLLIGAGLTDAGPEVMIAAALVPIVALGSLRGAALSGLQRVVLGQLPESIFRPVLFLLLVFVAIVLSSGTELLPAQVMGLHVAAAATALGLGAVLLKKVRPVELTGVEKQSDSSNWSKAVLPLSLVAGLQVLISNTDILMLGIFRSDAETGVYRVIAQCSIFLTLGSQALSQVLAPRFAAEFQGGNTLALQHLAVMSARIGLALALPVGLVFLIFGEPLLELLFGAEYVAGYSALLILLTGRILNLALGQPGLLLQMTGHEKPAMFATIVAASLNIALNLLLIPYFGIEGAAMATGISLVCSHLLLRRFVRTEVGIESSVVVFQIKPVRGSL